MQRETSVKGLIFTNPASYIEPFSNLGNPFLAKARSQPKTEFIIFFLGSYGQSVFTEFRQLRKRNPTWIRGKRITMDVYSDEDFIRVSEANDPVELLAQCCNCDFVCFVMDSLESGSVALAERIGCIVRESVDAPLVCLSPLGTEGLGEDQFNLSVETLFGGQDLCANLLIALYRNYLGDRGFRDIIGASKTICRDLLKDRYLHSHCGMAVHEGEINTMDVQALVKEANQSIQDLIQGESNGGYLAFLEMHPSKEDIILMVGCEIQRELHKLTKDHKSGNGLIMICNCAHPQDKIELILFYLYESQASI